jgi:hypothetical protein
MKPNQNSDLFIKNHFPEQKRTFPVFLTFRKEQNLLPCGKFFKNENPVHK